MIIQHNCFDVITCDVCNVSFILIVRGEAKDHMTFIWNSLTCDPRFAIQLSFIHGQLSHSQHQAMITLIEKKDKDKKFLKNWRPISLINVDAKIASKCLAFRIRNILSSLILSDQTA